MSFKRVRHVFLLFLCVLVVVAVVAACRNAGAGGGDDDSDGDGSEQTTAPGDETSTDDDTTSGDGSAGDDTTSDSDVGPPAEVRALSIASADSELTLTWVDPADADLDHVAISWSPDGPDVEEVPAGQESFTLDNLENGSVYMFEVTCVDAQGNASDPKIIYGRPEIPVEFVPGEYEVEVVGADTLTDLSEGLGGSLKLEDTDNRVVVFDYANYRILIYEKGATFEEFDHIATIGEHSLVENEAPYDPSSNPRLNEEYTGAIYDGLIWVINADYGEILRFDLDGTYIDSISQDMTALEPTGGTLYGLHGTSIYEYNEVSESFEEKAGIPGDIEVVGGSSDDHVAIDYGRIAVSEAYGYGNVVEVYDSALYFAGDSDAHLFSITATESTVTTLEILPDRIIVADGNDGNYITAGLDGEGLETGCFDGGYASRYSWSGHNLYVSASGSIRMYDADLLQLDYIRCFRFTIRDYKLVGADADSLYFEGGYDESGISVWPLDDSSMTYLADDPPEIPYSGWEHVLRMGKDKAYLHSEWPPDTHSMYVFDLDNMTETHFEIAEPNDFDVAWGDIYILRGTEVEVYDDTGTRLDAFALSNLSGSNLEGVDESADLRFATNGLHLYVYYEYKLNCFGMSGVFEEMLDWDDPRPVHYGSRLSCTLNFAYLTEPLSRYDLVNHTSETFMESNTIPDGYMYRNTYWENVGVNTYRATVY